MTTLQLTPTQHAVLAYAIEHHGGKIDWFPEHVKGGARKKVLEGLAGRTLIEARDTEWLVADAGYAALGLERPAPMPLVDDPEVESIVTAAEAEWTRVDLRLDAPEENPPEPESQPEQAPHDAQPPVSTQACQQDTPPASGRTRANTKQALVIEMLKRPEGATVAQIMAATGWLNHTVRGTLSGVLHKRLGLTLVSDKNADGVRAYRIV
jgi:hypothetical protein